ncbi:MAG: hypothetical protein KF822_12435 [Steroidobacteraceae bacterium]|nr:hypothetical protein [Steroidobacteraceae bacterium]
MSNGNARKLLATVVGDELTGLPSWKPNELGDAIVGKYVGEHSYETQDKDAQGKATGRPRTVSCVKLAGAVVIDAASGDAALHRSMIVARNADTKHKLDADTLAQGCYLLIQFTSVAADFNHMRRYRVAVISEGDYREFLFAAGAPQSQP